MVSTVVAPKTGGSRGRCRSGRRRRSLPINSQGAPGPIVVRFSPVALVLLHGLTELLNMHLMRTASDSIGPDPDLDK